MSAPEPRYTSCSICSRPIDRPGDEIPLCGPCQRTAEVAGKQAASEGRYRAEVGDRRYGDER